MDKVATIITANNHAVMVIGHEETVTFSISSKPNEWVQIIISRSQWDEIVETMK